MSETKVEGTRRVSAWLQIEEGTRGVTYLEFFEFDCFCTFLYLLMVVCPGFDDPQCKCKMYAYLSSTARQKELFSAQS